MSTSLLLDLDDTLLQNKIDDFLPHYLKSYSDHVSDSIEPDLFVHALLAGTRAMSHNRHPDCTLKEVFESVFFPIVGVDPISFRIEADRFYDQIFPSLRTLTHPIPQAGELVQSAADRGLNMAITTNPLFPRQAILHRLTWAELPIALEQFRLITSYETFHFAKPEPAYFAEVMGRLGWPADTVIVIGDDYKRDIQPARLLGLPTYWINGRDKKVADPGDLMIGIGPLEQFYYWLDHRSLESLQSGYSSSPSWLATMLATPAVLDSYRRSMIDADWTLRPSPNEWSLTEILCHLRDVDLEVNLPRLRNVIESDNPFIPAQDTDPWADVRRYRLQDGKQAFYQFLAARLRILELLEGLDESGWERPARHSIFGPTRLKELVNIIAAHDRLHLQQVYRLLEIIAPGREKA